MLALRPGIIVSATAWSVASARFTAACGRRDRREDAVGRRQRAEHQAAQAQHRGPLQDLAPGQQLAQLGRSLRQIVLVIHGPATLPLFPTLTTDAWRVIPQSSGAEHLFITPPASKPRGGSRASQAHRHRRHHRLAALPGVQRRRSAHRSVRRRQPVPVQDPEHRVRRGLPQPRRRPVLRQVQQDAAERHRPRASSTSCCIEPARVAAAVPKCFYHQTDHWTGWVVQGRAGAVELGGPLLLRQGARHGRRVHPERARRRRAPRPAHAARLPARVPRRTSAPAAAASTRTPSRPSRPARQRSTRPKR